VYGGPYKIRVEEKDIPPIEHPNDAILRVTLTAICGSDLHLYHGMMPDTGVGMTFGHAAMARIMFAQLPAKEYPYLAELTADHVLQPGYNYADKFALGLDLILDGLEGWLERHRLERQSDSKAWA
jgi:hypothetical protein